MSEKAGAAKPMDLFRRTKAEIMLKVIGYLRELPSITKAPGVQP